MQSRPDRRNTENQSGAELRFGTFRPGELQRADPEIGAPVHGKNSPNEHSRLEPLNRPTLLPLPIGWGEGRGEGSVHGEWEATKPPSKLSRREWLGLGAGALLSLGLWPGCARFGDSGRGGAFTFVVINDTHYQSPKCGEWFQRVAASIKSHHPRPEFCLVVGDLAEHGTTEELGAMREVLRSFGIPFHAVIGNHDYVSPIDRRPYENLFPRRLNYQFAHRGWRFIGLDSSEGMNYRNTRIQPATFQWLEATLPKLERAQPTVIFTHFPLGDGVPMRPMNADALLTPFLEFNLVAVFNGHFHGFTERTARQTVLTTNKCCASSRANHDRTPEKGYFLCSASAGGLRREFVEVAPT